MRQFTLREAIPIVGVAFVESASYWGSLAAFIGAMFGFSFGLLCMTPFVLAIEANRRATVHSILLTGFWTTTLCTLGATCLGAACGVLFGGLIGVGEAFEGEEKPKPKRTKQS